MIFCKIYFTEMQTLGKMALLIKQTEGINMNEAEEKENEIESRLSDSSWIWEGLGADGIQYPNSVAFHGKLNWKQTVKNRREFDEEFYLRIGNYAKEYRQAVSDNRKRVIEATVGHILINQLIAYCGGSNDE